MKESIKAVFNEILAMSDAEFFAALKSHGNSALAQALIAAWKDVENEYHKSDIGKDEIRSRNDKRHL